MASSPVRVFVDLPNWLGDLIHAIPALRRLSHGETNSDVVAGTPAAFVPLVRTLGVAAVARPPRAGSDWAGEALAARFDVALTTRHSTRAKLLLARSRAGRRLASCGRGAALLGLETFRVDRTLHQRHDLDDALDKLGIAGVDDRTLRLDLPDGWLTHGERWRSRFSQGERLAVLLPGSSNDPMKRYPVASYQEVARELLGAGITPVMMGGPGDDALAVSMADVSGVRLAPLGLSLEFAGALLAASDVAIGNDSGLTHLAAAVGCPTVALYGPTDVARTCPVGGATVLAVSRFRNHASWSELPPNEVARTACSVLDRERSRARGLRCGATDGMMRAGGGPLAQLAEQGTLNP